MEQRDHKANPHLGYVPEDDNPNLIDFPVSSDWAMHYTLKGYEVPMRMIRFHDAEDRRRYVGWLKGEPEGANAEVVKLRQEISSLRGEIERRQPRQEYRQAPMPAPRQNPPAKAPAPPAKPEGKKPTPRVINLEADDE